MLASVWQMRQTALTLGRWPRQQHPVNNTPSRNWTVMDHNASPLNPLPPIVWVIALPMILIEVVLNLGGRGVIGGADALGWRIAALERFAFFPDVLRNMVKTGSYPADDLLRLVSYPLVQGNLTNAVFAVVIFLALGNIVGGVFRWWAIAVVFFGSAAFAALFYAAIPVLKTALVGGGPAYYGMIGAFTFLLWVRLIAQGANQYRAFTLIGFLLFAQFLFGAVFGGGTEWVADIAGFAAGFMLSFVVSPGGWARVQARLRQR
jgi:membrane associated rhomboid family serine protease